MSIPLYHDRLTQWQHSQEYIPESPVAIASATRARTQQRQDRAALLEKLCNEESPLFYQLFAEFFIDDPVIATVVSVRCHARYLVQTYRAGQT